MNVKTLAEEQSLRGPSFFVSSRPATGARHSSYPDNVTRYKEDSRTETEIEMHCDEEATEGGGENEEGDAMFCENC